MFLEDILLTLLSQSWTSANFLSTGVSQHRANNPSATRRSKVMDFLENFCWTQRWNNASYSISRGLKGKQIHPANNFWIWQFLKNWQWDGQVDVPRPEKREHALIHVNVGDSSTISYIIPMVTGPKGYESLLEVHIDTISVTSSLNDIKLLTSESCRVSAFVAPVVL